MVYLLNMTLHFLTILLLASSFSFTSAIKDPCSITNSYNLTTNSSIFIRVGKSLKEIKLDNYFLKFGLKKLLTETLELQFSNIVKVIEIGKSAFAGNPIWAVQISRDVQKKRKILKPMFKFVANINGDETVGYALMVSLIQYLVYSDGVDDRITTMLNTTDIWIVPTMNPDRLFSAKKGFVEDTFNRPVGPYNGRLIELDKDFPDRILEDTWPRQEETEIMLDFIKKNPFVLSGNLQGCGIVASYPFDNSYSSDEHGILSLSPDNDVFEKLAKEYAELNLMMASGKECGKSFPGGITNGNYWRKKPGSMQDANYFLSNCFEITLHVSCCRWAPPSDLPLYWAANLPSMLHFIESIHQGIFGLVKDKEGKPVKGASVEVKGINKHVLTTEYGEYWRLLVPGSYNVTARAPPTFLEETLPVELTNNNRHVQLNFVLTRQSFYGTVVNNDNENPIKEGVIKAIQIDENNNEGDQTDTKVLHGKFGMKLRPGLYEITASGPNYKSYTEIVHVTEHEPTEIYIRLTRLGVFGTVKDLKGKPITDAVVGVLSEENVVWVQGTKQFISIDPGLSSDTHRRVAKITPDEQGEFWLSLEEGKYTLYAGAPASSHQLRTVELNSLSPFVQLDFRLKFNGDFQGVYGFIVDKDNRPVRGSAVRIIGGDGVDMVVKIDASGYFRKRLFKGFYLITVIAPDYSGGKRFVNIDYGKSVNFGSYVIRTKKRKFLNCFG